MSRERIAELEAEVARLRAELEAVRGHAGGISPLAPERFPDLPPIAGVHFATAEAGVRYTGRTDVMLAAIDPGAQIAGVFTRSTTRSAPVIRCEEALAEHAAGAEAPGGFAILVNSGNANAFTGGAGFESVDALRAEVARELGCPEGHVFTSSTGVIGERLPHERIVATLDALAQRLDPAAIEPAARAIMTTDTFPKGAAATAEIDGTQVHVAGIAKGSGMIAPDMATMLAYVFTDAAVAQPVLQQILWLENAPTFNAITVDSDTSTSDTLLLVATGKAEMPPITDFADPRVAPLRAALRQVMQDLAIQIVRDGEGATKLIEVRVTGANGPGPAHRVAKAIANSPLVKTAAAGEDPNWGRIVMAVGKSGERAERDRLSIWLGDILVAEKGWVAPSYTEEAGAEYMKRDHIVITVDLGLDQGRATVWTCDLTHGYIEINADYRS